MLQKPVSHVVPGFDCVMDAVVATNEFGNLQFQYLVKCVIAGG